MMNANIRLGLVMEVMINLLLWVGWIVWMISGTENGFGYFHQPGHSLFWPMINGALFNALTFGLTGFYLVPKYLARKRPGGFLLGLAVLASLVLSCKSVVEKLIIALQMPDLAELSFIALAVENLYPLLAFILLGILYRFVRDWFADQHHGNHAARPDWANQDTVLLVKAGTAVHRVLVNNILHVKSEGNYVIFYDTGKKVMAHMTMAEVLERLPADQFIRIHRSHIASLAHIDRIEANRVLIRDQYLPIGGKYREAFMQQMNLSFRQ